MIEKAPTKTEQVLGAGYDQPRDGAHPASPAFSTREYGYDHPASPASSAWGYGYDQGRNGSSTKPRSIHTPADDGSLSFVEVI